MAERVGFEPTCPLRDKTLSRRPRYDHFGTSPLLTSLSGASLSSPPRCALGPPLARRVPPALACHLLRSGEPLYLLHLAARSRSPSATALGAPLACRELSA